MSVCAFLLAVLSVGALAQPNETFYVDSEWVVPVNTTSDGSIQRPFLNLSAVADAISDWAMQGIDMAVVSVHLAPRLYSGPANCFQVLNLLVMAEFELDGAWTNGNGSSNSTGTPLATATFECVNTAPKNAQQLVWLGLFGARDRFAMSNVTFRNSHAICSDMWLTYDVSLDEPPMKMLCETYQGKPRVVCGGVVLSTAQHHAGTAVIFRGVHFHHNVVNVTNPGPGMATALTNAVRKSHSPLVILARGVVHSCDSVTIANSTFVNNTLEVVEFPTSDSQAMWGLFRTYSAVGGGALSVSGGQFELANCTFVDNVAQFSLLESLTVNVIGHGFTDIVAGGAVLIDMGSDLAVMNSTFVNNVAIGFRSAGGAIALCWPDEKAITHDQRHSSIFALVRGSVFTNNSVSDGSKLGYWADLPSELDITAARIVYEGAGGAIAFGLVSPNSTRSFVPVPTALRDCTFDSNSVVVEALMSTEKMPCFGGAVMSSVLTVIDVVFNDNVVDCVDASGGAIETILIVVENTTFARNAARSTWADRSTGGSISNRVLPTIDSSTCARMTWSLTNCSFVGNASVGANDAAHIRGAAIWIDPQCTPNVGDFTDLSFVGFRAATIVDATGLRLYPRMFTIQDCSGSFVFRTTDESAASSAYTAKFVIWNSSARFGPLVTVNSIDVRLNVIAANVSMLADPIVHLTALHAVVVPFIDDCECISSFECDSTALHIQSQLGNSSVLIADGFFRRVRGKAIVRVVQKDFADSTTLRVSGLQFVDCEVGSVLAIEKREATAVLSEQFFLVIDSVFLNNTIATSILRWMSLGVPQRIAIGIEMSQIAFQNVTVVGNRAFASDDVVAIELVVVDRFAREVDGARSNAAVHLIDCVFRDNVGLAVARGADLYIEGLLFVNNSVSGSVFAWLHGWAVIQASNATFIQNRGALVHAEAVDGTIDQLPSVIGFMGLNVLDHIVDRPLIWVSLPQANVSVALVETAFDNINSEDSLVAALYVTNVVVSRTVFHRVLVNARTPTCGGALFIGRADAVALSSAVFVNTSAAFGGAICLGRTTTFAAANVTFANNSAHVGPDIYYVSPDVAHAIDVNLKAASVASAVSLSGFERGVMPGVPVDLTFAARDVFGRMPPANQQHAISMVRYAVELTTVNCTHDLNDVSFLCIINEYDHECVARVVFRGAPDTDCALNFMLRPIDAVLPRALDIVGGAPTLTGSSVLAIVPCRIGFGATSSQNGTTLCEPCSPGTYNIDAAVQRCFACDTDRLFCAGRDLVAVQDGYWARQLGDGSIATFLCDADVCVAGAPGGELSRCVPGREGVLCATCSEPSFTPVAPSDGVSCIECRGVSVPLVIGGIAAVAVLAFVLHVAVVGTSARVKVLFFYTQTVALVLPKSVARTVFAAFDFRPVSGSAAFGGLCVAPLNGFELLALHLSYPLLLATTLTLIFLVRHAVVALWRLRSGDNSARNDSSSLPSTVPNDNNNNNNNNNGDDNNDVPLVVSSNVSLSTASATDSVLPSAPLFSWVRWQRSIMSFVFLSFSVVLDCAIKLTQCDEIDRSLSVLAADARELCRSDGLPNPLYAQWRALALYGLAPYVMVIVIALPLITWRRHTRPHARLWRNKVRWGFLSDGYRSRFHYWECVILARRITFGLLCALLPLDSEMRQQAVLAACLVALSAHVMARPFVHDSDNAAESLSLLALTFNGAAFQRTLFSRSGVGFYLSVVCIVAPAVVIGVSIGFTKLRSLVSLIRRRRRAAAR